MARPTSVPIALPVVIHRGQSALKVAVFMVDHPRQGHNLSPMNLNTITSKDLATITKLLKKKECLLDRVAKVDAKLSAFEGGKPVAAVVKKGGMSAAGRKAIAAAQKARWAKVKKGKRGEKPVGKRKHKMSAAGRAAIIAAQKARWAKMKVQKPF